MCAIEKMDNEENCIYHDAGLDKYLEYTSLLNHFKASINGNV